MVMTVDLAIVLIITVLRSKYRRTYRTGKMVDMVFSVQGCDIRSAQSAIAFVAYQIEATKVIGFAKRILPFSLLFLYGEKLRGDNLATVLNID